MKQIPSDRQIMEQLYELYEQKMFMTAYSILRDHHQAEDAVQEAFIKLSRHLSKFSDDPASAKCRKYILVTIKDVSIDLYRKNRTDNTCFFPVENEETACFVCLTIQVASSRKRDILKFSTYYDIEFYKENTDGTLVFDEEYVNEESFGKPIYFDASLTDHNDPDFFFTKIPAGQTVTFHLGYFVDEDHLDEMFLRTDGGSSEIYYLTDIRQKK